MGRVLAYTYWMRLRLLAVVFVLLTVVSAAPAPARPASPVLPDVPTAFVTPVPVAPGPTAVAPGGERTGAAARLLVHFRPEASDGERARALASVGGIVTGGIPDLGVTRVAAAGGGAGVDGGPALEVPPRSETLAALLAMMPAVEWAEADRRVSLDLTPNDPYFFNDPYSGLGQWGLRKIQADKAWDIVRGSPQIIVAVVDTGVDPAHPDLATVVLPSVTFNSAPNAGCTQQLSDDNGHGTHVAGIIGAAGNDGVGVVGTAFGVRLLPIKALDCQGTGVVGDIAQAILYAVNNGARVINISLGAPSDSPTLRSAVQAAALRNVLIVAAAGNCGIGGESCDAANEISYPAAYPGALAVAATDINDARASFSTAASYVGIAAPGRTIVSTSPTYPTFLSRRSTNPTTARYAVISGTSQATPFVSGVAALVLSREPNLSALQLRQRLVDTADHLGTPGTNPQFGAGRVNAAAAVAVLAAPAAQTYGATYDSASVPRTAAKGATTAMTVRVTNTSSFTWSAAGPQPVRLAYHWSDPTGNTIVWEGQRTLLAADLPPAQSATIAMNVLVPPQSGPYLLRFDVVQEGVSWFSGKGVPTANVAVTVNGGYGATYVVGATASSSLVLGAAISLPMTLTNTGSRVWPAAGPNPVRLSYHWVRPDGSVLTWEGQRTLLAADVAPAESATVSLAVSPPAVLGPSTLRVDLVQEGLTWFSGEGVPVSSLTFNVTSGLVPTWTVTSPPAALPGGRVKIPVTVRNEGAGPWAAAGATPVRLAAHIVDAVGNTVLWDGPRTLLLTDVAPGASFSGELIVPVPLTAGSYRVRADLVQEGVTWFSAQGARTGEVQLPVLADFRATVGVSTTSVSRASPVAQVTVTNTSSAVWTAGGLVPIALAAHWFDAQGAVLVWDGPRTMLAQTLAPGESITLAVPLGPPPPAAARLAVDVIAEGLLWYGAGLPRSVTIIP